MLTMGAEAYPPSDGVPVGMGVGTTWCVWGVVGTEKGI